MGHRKIKSNLWNEREVKMKYKYYSGDGNHSIKTLEIMIKDRDKYILEVELLNQELKELLTNITKEQTFFEFEANVDIAREFIKKLKN